MIQHFDQFRRATFSNATSQPAAAYQRVAAPTHHCSGASYMYNQCTNQPTDNTITCNVKSPSNHRDNAMRSSSPPCCCSSNCCCQLCCRNMWRRKCSRWATTSMGSSQPMSTWAITDVAVHTSAAVIAFDSDSSAEGMSSASGYQVYGIVCSACTCCAHGVYTWCAQHHHAHLLHHYHTRCTWQCTCVRRMRIINCAVLMTTWVLIPQLNKMPWQRKPRGEMRTDKALYVFAG